MVKIARNLTLALLLAAPLWAQTHSATLSWTASTSAGITGYDVYRVANTAASCPAFSTTGTGAWTLLTTTPVAGTTYTDASPITTGACYAATTVSSTGTQSIASNMVILPAPPSSMTITGAS